MESFLFFLLEIHAHAKQTEIYAGVNYENGTKGGRAQFQRREQRTQNEFPQVHSRRTKDVLVRSQRARHKSWLPLTREVSVPHSLGDIDAVADDGAAGGERLVERHAQQDDTVVKGADEKVDLGTRRAI